MAPAPAGAAGPPPDTLSERTTVKAVIYTAPRDFAVRDIDVSEPGPGDVRISVHQTGLCGTDKHIHEGDFTAAFPVVPGHEIVGTVDAVGDLVEGFEPGQWVTVNPNISCGHCFQCRRGRPLQSSARWSEG